MDTPTYKTKSTNALTELSELRLEAQAAGDEISLTCKLIFGTMPFSHSGREYEIGCSRAYLRLNLEGCETKIGTCFAEQVMEPAKFEEAIESVKSSRVGASASADISLALDANAKYEAERSNSHRTSLTSSQSILPVRLRPNNTWIIDQSKNGANSETIEGTAVPSAHLCTLSRSPGGNRVAIIGEVQTTRKNIKVKSTSPFKGGRYFDEFQNKDAIVGQILRLALAREASHGAPRISNPTIVIARTEVSEEM